MSTTELIDRIKEELLTCTICLEEYDNEAHRPLLLQCRHIVCDSCVQRLVQGSEIMCPADRTKFRIPVNGVRDIDVDETTKDINNFVRRSGTLPIDAIKDKFLKCLKCRSSYDEAEHVPLSLPCQHPLCFSCVASGRVHCPVDGNSWTVLRSELPKNNTLRELRGLLSNISHQQVPSQSIRTNSHRGTRQQQRAHQTRQPSWSEDIRNFDLDESVSRLDRIHETHRRGNHMVNIHWQPEYAGRGSPQPFHLPAISNNLNRISQDATYNMGDVMRNIERGVQAALRGTNIVVQQIQRMAQYRD
ncbi:hypothetical protein ACJMK2_019068 [Sinanodonta woodiana]|uniref:RING-type domain-containing protein n=1 Tax=Sinanodonta woodiana TaxID=1069815 RepID=A0ABD3UF95_SINWO